MDRFGRCTHILHIKVPEAFELVLQRAVHGVVSVAGITGLGSVARGGSENVAQGCNSYSARTDFVRGFPCCGTKCSMPSAGNAACERTCPCRCTVSEERTSLQRRESCPWAPTVIEERTRNTPASTIVSTINAMRTRLVPTQPLLGFHSDIDQLAHVRPRFSSGKIGWRETAKTNETR